MRYFLRTLSKAQNIVLLLGRYICLKIYVLAVYINHTVYTTVPTIGWFDSMKEILLLRKDELN